MKSLYQAMDSVSSKALLITLAEQGLDKEMAVLAHDVMSEIRNHVRFY